MLNPAYKSNRQRKNKDVFGNLAAKGK